MSIRTDQDDGGELIPIVIYAARSAPDDRDKSTDEQIDEIRERLVQLDGRFEYAGPFAESGQSGSRKNRGPDLAAALDAVKRAADEHGHSELWLWRSNRPGRGTGLKGQARAVGALLYELRAEGVTVRSVEDDEFCTNEVLWGITSSQASGYSVALSGDVKRGKRGQLARHERLGGPLPDGYAGRVERDGRDKIVARKYWLTDRAPVMARIFTLAGQGESDATIAATLNAEGSRTATGRPWTRRRIQDTVTNPWYAGYIAQRGENLADGKWRTFSTPRIAGQGDHPRIVEPDEWDRVMDSRAARDLAPGQHGRRPGRPPRRDLLTDLAHCNRCGEKLRGRLSSYRRKRDGGKARKYICPNALREVGLCDLPAIDAGLVDRAVLARLHADFLGLREWHGSLLKGRDAKRDAALADLERDGQRLAKLERVLPKLDERLVDAIDREDEADERAIRETLARQTVERDELRARIAGHERRLDELSDDAAPGDAMLDAYNRIAEALRGRDGEALAVVNGRLRRFFDRFDLEVLEGPMCNGALVSPALKPTAFLDIFGEPKAAGEHPLILTTNGEPILPPVPDFAVIGGPVEKRPDSHA